MARFNTLSVLPFYVGHGQDDSALAVSPDTLVRWYWRVRRWHARLSVDDCTYEGNYVPANASSNYATPIDDETGLLLPCNLILDGAASVAGGTDADQTAIAGFTFVVSLYDPDAKCYQWRAPDFNLVAKVDGFDLQASTSYAGDHEYTVDLSVSIEGRPLRVSAEYSYTRSADSDGTEPEPPAPTCTLVLTAIEYWGYDGKYDPATGAKN